MHLIDNQRNHQGRLEIAALMGYAENMPDNGAHLIGLLADSHGDNRRLACALSTLEEAGAGCLVHLGDICDSLTPAAFEESMQLLRAHEVQAVLGNNEYSLLNDSQAGSLSPAALGYLRSLPYTRRHGELWFTHSIPFAWPAATRRPISEYLGYLARQEQTPFRVLFRGHSHSASLIRIAGGSAMEWTISAPAPVALDPHAHYIVTVGAVEDGLCALFDTRRCELQLIDVR